jgi:hypothetical protein
MTVISRLTAPPSAILDQVPAATAPANGTTAPAGTGGVKDELNRFLQGPSGANTTTTTPPAADTTTAPAAGTTTTAPAAGDTTTAPAAGDTSGTTTTPPADGTAQPAPQAPTSQ